MLFGCFSGANVRVTANVGPSVSAGQDQSVSTGADFTLTGTATDSDGTIASTRWLLDGAEIGTGLSVTTSIASAGAETYTFEATDDDGATATATVTVTASAAAVASFITSEAGVPEHRYIDYSTGMGSGVERDRILQLGADVSRLDSRIDYTHVDEPAANPAAIQAAIDRVTARSGGGIVRPLAGSVAVTGSSTQMQMKDNVLFDGSRLTGNTVRGSGIAFFNFEGVQDAAILNLAAEGGDDPVYLIRVGDSQNILVQNCEADDFGRDSIRFRTQNRDVTVRYCRVDSLREEQGGSDFRNQHGIVSASGAGGISEHFAPSSRFGIIYSQGFAIYSNEILHVDGHSIDCHASNVEICGNWTDDCNFGMKLPHADNVLLHRNRFGGQRSGDPWALRLYCSPDGDYDAGIGYPGDKIVVARNRFDELTHTSRIRVEKQGGLHWFMDNVFASTATTYLFDTPGTDGPAPESRYYMHGADKTAPRSATSDYNGLILDATDADIIALDPARIATLFNSARVQSSHDIYTVEPLATVAAYT